MEMRTGRGQGGFPFGVVGSCDGIVGGDVGCLGCVVWESGEGIGTSVFGGEGCVCFGGEKVGRVVWKKEKPTNMIVFFYKRV